MSRLSWVRQLFHRPPVAVPVVKSPRTRLGLQRLEERDTPATFLVTTTADSGAGSLRDAVAQANATAGADTIIFQAGLGPVTLTSGQLSITDTTGATTITGPSTGTQLVQRSTAAGTPLFRLFNISSGVTASLNNLTITNGRSPSGSSGSDNQGGGIRNVGKLTITNSVISGNGGTVISIGGGIFNGGGGATLTIKGSTISGNSGLTGVASNGGGISNSSGGTVTITSSTISGNVATFDTGSGGSGGGIFNSGIMTVTSSTISGNSGLTHAGISNSGTLTVTNSTISGNTANNTLGGSGNGGGIGNGGTLTLTGSTVSGNTARNQAGNASGGGLFSSGTLTITNSTFSGNEAIVQNGGGISITGGTATLTHVTIFGNRSNGLGGGLSRSGGTVTLHNSIVAGNASGSSTPNDINGALTTGSSFNIISHAATAGGLSHGTNGNQVGVDPLLGLLEENGGPTKTHTPLQSSPALGAASATVASFPLFDQRGTPRDASLPDIGAHEVQHPLATIGGPTSLAAMYAPKPSATANEAFIKGLFRTTLQREASAADVAAWMPYFGAPFNFTRAQIANGFVNSTENRNNQVQFFFLYFLGRPADTFGLTYWTAQLQSGVDESVVMNGFLLSPEFTQNNNNTQFVNTLYYGLLGRTDPGPGVTAWVDLLNSGMSRGTVSNGFLRSQEGMRRIVRSQFQTYLMRGLTDADADTFAGYLQANTFGQLAILILSSDEFYANAANNLT
ncbi:MAG: DUF4214 domain-containing protein [Fimbriiglobus sp.]|jgi:hypothetical protein|nr:DUF4214 domain-containing protein [Fimbriiglobus sp.]